MVRLTASHRLPPNQPFNVRTTLGAAVTTATMGTFHVDLDLAVGCYIAESSAGSLQFDVVTSEATTRTESSPPPPATPTSPGVLQLSGDLAGDSTAPTVPALASKADVSDPRFTDAREPLPHTHAKADVTGLDADLILLPTQGQKNALQGTQGTPGETNRYVTNQGLSAALNAKADTSHTHTRAQISDFPHQHPVTDITATGTPSSSTVLYGDGWRTPPAGGGGGDTKVRLTADHAPYTLATLTNIIGLSFSVAANTVYEFSARIVFRSSTATVGIRLGLTCPTFAVMSANVHIPIAADGTGAMFHGALTFSGDAVIGTAVPAINTDYVAEIRGVIEPTAAGTVQLQAGTETTPGTVTVRRASFLTYGSVA